MTWLRTLHLNKPVQLKSHWDKLIEDGRTLTKVSMSGKKNLNKLYCDLVNSNMLLMNLWNGLEELTRPWTPSNQSMAIPKSLKLSWLNSKLWSMISKLIKAVWIRWMMLVAKSSNLEKVCSFFFFVLIQTFGVETFLKFHLNFCKLCLSFYWQSVFLLLTIFLRTQTTKQTFLVLKIKTIDKIAEICISHAIL